MKLGFLHPPSTSCSFSSSHHLPPWCFHSLALCSSPHPLCPPPIFFRHIPSLLFLKFFSVSMLTFLLMFSFILSLSNNWFRTNGLLHDGVWRARRLYRRFTFHFIHFNLFVLSFNGVCILWKDGKHEDDFSHVTIVFSVMCPHVAVWENLGIKL